MKTSTPESKPSWACPGNSLAQSALAAIELALVEDLGLPATDLTTEAIVNPEANAKASIYCQTKEAIIAGLPIIETVLHKLDPGIVVTLQVEEGVRAHTVPLLIACITGNARAILIGERVVLNLLQRMCAVATATALFVEKAKEFNIAILDTRKTTPGLRVFEKYAVSIGGGTNHRFGLNDAILIKDNHINIAGSITKAVSRVREKYKNKPIEVECTNLTEVQECLDLAVEKIMLDNMSPASIKEAVSLIDQRSFIEASGGINLNNIQTYLLPGINAISMGAITHSATGIDINLEFEG